MQKEFNTQPSYLRKILKTNFALPNGELAAVFIKNRNQRGYYDCLLCSATQLSPHNLVQHANGRRHNTNIGLVDTYSGEADSININDAATVKQYPYNLSNSFKDYPTGSGKTDSAKCVPPCQTEDTRSDGIGPKVSKLQTTIDEIKDLPFVGMEHVLDIQLDDESSYLCVLCQNKFDRISDVVEHLTSYNHRLRYLQTFFPKLFDDVSYLIGMVCEELETKFHRSKVIILEKREFLDNKEKFIQLSSTEYINKTIGCSELIVPSTAEDDTVPADDPPPVICDETISISSDTSSDETTPSATTVQLATFWSQMVAVKNELMKTYQLYVTNPCSYPGYPQMWTSFWNTRFAELRHTNQLNTYDWRSEWSMEWRKIMNEKLKADMEVKYSRIKKTLGITDDMLGKREREFVEPPKLLLDTIKPVVAEPTPQVVLPEKSIAVNVAKSSIPHHSAQQPTANPNKTTVTSNDQNKKATFSNKLGLEQLLEKHNHNDDFLISWRELLDIFGIDDNNTTNGTESTSHRANQKDPSKKQMDLVDNAAVQVQPAGTVESVTVISVLRILVALEDILGSFAPKVIDLLQTAIAMEALRADSSSALLNSSNNNCILFETVKEKFKGLLLGDLVAENLQKCVRKAIDDMTTLLESAEKSKTCYVLPTFNRNVDKPSPPYIYLPLDSLENEVLPSIQNAARAPPPQPHPIKDESPKNCYMPSPSHRIEKASAQPQPSAPIENLKRCVFKPLVDRNVEKPSSPPQSPSSPPIEDINEPATLTDFEIKILMMKFSYLSDSDKHNFTTFLKKLRLCDPNRLAQLKNEICENMPCSKSTVLEWEKEMNRSGEAAYSNLTNYILFESDDSDKGKSIAYQVAQKNASCKIKRRRHTDLFEGKRFYED